MSDDERCHACNRRLECPTCSGANFVETNRQTLREEIDNLKESLHYCNGVADLCIRERAELQEAWTRREKVWADVLNTEIMARKVAEAALTKFMNDEWEVSLIPHDGCECPQCNGLRARLGQ